MNKILITISILLLLSATSLAQLSSQAYFNRSAQDQADTLRPWLSGGVRTVQYAGDMDGDGKPEILATDYSNGGRVHVLEYNNNEVLELVWSSPTRSGISSGSTPRWVRTGDLDGDGNAEIIFSQTDGSADGRVLVYEHKGSDNDYGTESIIDFPANIFNSLGVGDFRTNREQGWVHDFDGDGKSELIMANRDSKVYILGINGNAPGFASWQIEGGDPNVHPNNGFSEGSWWHSLPVDYDGDGVKEIVNHYWNFHGFWSIEPTGSDSYTYPPGNSDGNVFGPTYFEFYKNRNVDGVGFMGIAAADVDGDGKEEIASIIHPEYNISLVSLPQGANGVEVWNDSSSFAVLKTRDELTKQEGLQFWGCYAADLNGNGRDEILLGGFYGENIVAVEYSGSGDILDGANYDITYYYEGESESDIDWEVITISDSAGVIDTSYSKGVWKNPGVMKMTSGDIIGNDGKDELIVSYQSGSYGGSPVYDSTEVVHRTWNGSAWDETTEFIYNDKNIQIRVLQFDGATGLKPVNLTIITPSDYKIEQNYPNPFNPSTTIRFSLPLDKEISLVVYDMLGREVNTLISNQEFQSGSYEVTWDATNSLGSKVVSGNYIATLKFGNFTKSIKMMLLK